MRAVQFDFRERPLEEMPTGPLHPQEIYANLTKALQDLPEDKAIFVDAPEGSTQKDLSRLRGRIAAALQRRFGVGVWRLDTVPAENGIWIVRSTSAASPSAEVKSTPPPRQVEGPEPSAPPQEPEDVGEGTSQPSPADADPTPIETPALDPCACPDWWKEKTNGWSEEPGYLHHDRCPRHRHRWNVATKPNADGRLPATCLCGEKTDFPVEPETQPAHLRPKRVPQGRGKCSWCGHGFRSEAHKRCKEERGVA